MNLRIVFKFKDCELQFYEKRRLFCYFSESLHACQSLAPLVETKTRKKTLLRLSLASLSPHHCSYQQRSPFRLFIARQKLSNALKRLNRKKVYRNRPIERASECHYPHRINNSLLRMRAIHELKRNLPM